MEFLSEGDREGEGETGIGRGERGKRLLEVGRVMILEALQKWSLSKRGQEDTK